MNQIAETLSDIDAEKVSAFVHNATDAWCFIGWMDELINENVTMQVALVEGPDEGRIVRLAHIASQISAYRRIKDALRRALDIAQGNKPTKRLVPESAEGGVL